MAKHKAKTTDKKSTNKASKSSKKTASKKDKKAAAREAKKAARKGDGSFPDVLVVTKEKTEAGDKYFLGHGEDLATLMKNGETVGVYKLRRVSTVDIKRKIAR